MHIRPSTQNSVHQLFIDDLDLPITNSPSILQHFLRNVCTHALKLQRFDFIRTLLHRFDFLTNMKGNMDSRKSVSRDSSKREPIIKKYFGLNAPSSQRTTCHTLNRTL